MVFSPGVSFFTSFYGLDLSRDKKCIFYTQRAARCCNDREESDLARAMELRETIDAISADAIDFDLLQEYVLCTCCRRAKHRDRMEDIGLLTPLAQRWQTEILDHARIMIALGESVVAQDTRLAPTTFSYGSSRTAESRTRSRLRNHRTVNSSSEQTTLTSSSPLSEFRPHVATPGPCDSVSSRFLAPLERRDFERGSIYVFSRVSSPGHVKIGWTAGSVPGRLNSWSECGYVPTLLFSMSHIPHAQRVETLTHHELIREWRRERMCKAVHCRKSHQEWFETTPEKAAQVVCFWADFMRRALPYDLNGRLKTQWRIITGMMDKNKECITGEKLLEHYEKSLVQGALVEAKASPIHMWDDPKQELKVEGKEISIKDEQDLEQLDSLAEIAVCVDALSIEDAVKPKDEPLHGEPALLEVSLSKSEIQATNNPAHEKLARITITTVTEDIPPERIPLPPSPIVDPRTSDRYIPLLHVKGPDPDIGIEAANAIDFSPISLVNVTVANISS